MTTSSALHSPTGTTLGGRRLVVAFVALMAVNTMSGVDATIVATAAPTITSDLGRISLLPWISTAYLLAQVGTIALYGKLGDRGDRKRVFLGAAALFLVASVLCGAAQSMPQLVAFRALQGAGAGGLTSLSMALVADIAPPAKLGRYLGYAGLVFAVTSVIGPLTGGLFVDHLSWRWAFFVNVPVGLIGGAFVVALVHSRPRPAVRAPIDYGGAALIALTTTALVLLTSWGGTEHEWTSPVILGLGATAIGSIAALGWWEGRVTEPLLPLHVFRNRTIALADLANLVAGAAFTAGIVYLPVLYQAVVGRDATSSGLLLIPLGLSTALSTAIVGRIVERSGDTTTIPAFGMVAMGVAYGLLSTVDGDTTALFATSSALVAGIGVGCVMQTLLHLVQQTAPAEHLGMATSSVILGRILGSALGTALFGAVFNTRLASGLGAIPGVDHDSVHGDPESIRELAPAVRSEVGEAFAHALAGGFRALVPVMVVGLVSVVALRRGVPVTDRASASDS